MIATSQPTPLDQWRHRFGGRRRRTQPRPLAAMGYLTDGPTVNNLIEVEKFILVLLYDDLFRPGCCASRSPGIPAAAFRGAFSSAANQTAVSSKTLASSLFQGAQGYRIDVADEDLLELAIALNRQLDRHARFGLNAHERPFLPRLWAGFRPADAATITGDGAELKAYAARTGKSPQRLLNHLRRQHHDLVLHPLPWVSNRWQQAVTVFVDLDRFPRRQVFRPESLPDGLVGYHEATEFDFASRCSSRPQQRPHHQSQPVAAAV